MNKQNLAPVVVFTYNRYDETMKTMSALADDLLAKQTEVYVFSNAPIERVAGDKNTVNRIRKKLTSFENAFLKYNIIFREKNEGVNANMIPGIDEVIRKHGRVIVLEDDIVVCRGFLSFMNQALDEYEDDSDIFSICGYNPVAIKTNLPGDSFSYDAFRSWGWGIWLDRWNDYCMDNDYINHVRKIDLHKLHVEGLMYISTVRRDLIYVNKNEIRFLDYLLACKQMADKKTVIYSKKSLCDNIGLIDKSETSAKLSNYKNKNFDITYSKSEYVFSKGNLNINTDKRYFLKFRWDQFAMDMYYPLQHVRDGLLSIMYYALLQIDIHGENIAYFFKKNHYSRIAIYGWGEAGKLLYEIMTKLNISVSYVLDKKAFPKDRDIQIYQKIDDLPDADVLLVTALKAYPKIYENLYEKIRCPIYCLDDVVAECFNELEIYKRIK